MFLRTLFIVCFAFTLLGCNRGPRLVPVNGTVTLDGKPLAFKSVYFFPTGGSEGNNGSGGFTDKDGKYYLLANVSGTTKDNLGAQVGEYRVTVTESIIPISEKDFGPNAVLADADGPGLIPQKPVKREIPVPYTTESTTPLVIEVPEDGGVIDLALKKNP